MSKKKKSAKIKRKEKLFKAGPVTCALCAKEILHINEANWDHIIPRSLGGTGAAANLQITHRTCNRQRGNTPLLLSEQQLVEIQKEMAWQAHIQQVRCKPKRAFLTDVALRQKSP